MGRNHTVEKKSQAERLYVAEGVVALTMLEQRTGISRQTLAKWKIENDWDGKRKEFVVAPGELTDRLKKLVHRMLNDFDSKLAEKQFIAPSMVKDLESVIRSLYRIDGMFFTKGAMMQFLNELLDFAASDPQYREALPALRKIAQPFMDYIESK